MLQRTKQKYLPKPPDCADFEANVGSKPVDMGYVKGAFFVLMGGQVLAIVVMVVEFVIMKLK